METKKKNVNLDLKSLGMIAALIIIFIIFYIICFSRVRYAIKKFTCSYAIYWFATS